MTDNTRELKAYLHPLTAIVILGGQSVVSAVAGGVTVGCIAWYYQYPNPWAVGGAGAGVVFGVSWVVSLLWWRSRVEATGHQVVQAEAVPVVFPTEVIRVELHNPTTGPYWDVDLLDIPFPRELLIRAAGHLHDRDWETSNLGGANKPLSRSQAEALRDWMLGEDLAAWYREDRHTLGWVILPKGRAVLRRFYHAGIIAGDLEPPPSPRLPTPAERYFESAQTHTNTLDIGEY